MSAADDGVWLVRGARNRDGDVLRGMPVEGFPMNTTLNLLMARFRAISVVKRGLVLLGAMVLAGALVGRWTRPAMKGNSSTPAISEFQSMIDEPMASTPELNTRIDVDKLKQFQDAKLQANEPRSAGAGGIAGGSPYALPLIAHSAELAVATKEFAKSRTSLEEILEHHRGYAAKLRMAGRRTGSLLSATLRMPSSELGATVVDLKSLGDVEQEAQSADEVTQQHADLEARLANAQATLRRLKQLLEKQTYPDGN